jgi:hypothetical protein
MHKNVEIVIGRLATDPRLQDRFALEPDEVLHEQGLELSEVEIRALAATDPRALRTFTAALDTRLCKASRAAASQPTQRQNTESGAIPTKEIKR